MARAWCLIREQPHYRREAFVAGLTAAGYRVGCPDAYSLPPAAPGDVLAIWNRYAHYEEIAARFERAGGRVLVAENGYLGDDAEGRQHYALALGAHNGGGTWPSVGEGGAPAAEAYGARWARLGIALQPWRGHTAVGEEGHILVCPQRGIGPKNYAQPPDWPREVCGRLHALTGRPVRVRPHPGNKPAAVPMAQDLAGCWAVVTWASNAGTHALIAGVPVIYEGPYWICAGAASRELAAIEDPPMPERLPVFERLAWAQWTVAELASGEPFRRLLS